ncbi:MAG: tRNA (N(6)-L-threonylcarbamoyladenosine(37)-C(2))-methylthiotransferase [Haloferacaceae archaeon]
MARYHIETYGCTANRGESRRIERRLRDAGHHPADGPADADVAILNTCTVVEKTERNMLARARELESETADLVVTGCMALAQGEEFGDVDARVLHWDDVPTAVRNGECPTTTPDGEPVLDGVVGILPVARGCMSDCSYCITKQATGRIDSPPVERNVEKARALVHAGAREIRITGQDTGVYGWDVNQGESLLPELVERVCAIPGDFRVRVGMANPKGVHGVRHELARVFAEHEEVYDFLHAPVQSGSDDVLADMRRQHRVDEFREVVDAFDERLDEWTLSTDFIVGFPTEDEDDFAASMDLLREVRPERINVTRFSKRPGTDAADMKGLGGTVKKERSKAMTDLKMDVVSAAHEAMVGTERRVLAVEEGTGDSVKCRDGAYRQVVVREASEHGVEPGDFLDVEVTGAERVYTFGRPV